MEFIEAPAFTRMMMPIVPYRTCLLGIPRHGEVMPGTGGFRKLGCGTRMRLGADGLGGRPDAVEEGIESKQGVVLDAVA